MSSPTLGQSLALNSTNYTSLPALPNSGPLPSSPSSSNSHSHSHSHWNFLIGIAVGAVAIFAVLTIICIVYTNKKRRRRDEENSHIPQPPPPRPKDDPYGRLPHQWQQNLPPHRARMGQVVRAFEGDGSVETGRIKKNTQDFSGTALGTAN